MGDVSKKWERLKYIAYYNNSCVGIKLVFSNFYLVFFSTELTTWLKMENQFQYNVSMHIKRLTAKSYCKNKFLEEFSSAWLLHGATKLLLIQYTNQVHQCGSSETEWTCHLLKRLLKITEANTLISFISIV